MESSLPSSSEIKSDISFHEAGDDLGDGAENEALLRPLLTKPGLLPPRQGPDDAPTLTISDSRDGNWSPYLVDLHMLSISFLFIFLAYGAIQNLESSINTDQGLGSAALGVLYLSLTISSFGAPMVVMCLGSKKALLLGLSGYWVFIVANLYPSRYTLIPAALFLGFSASVLWVGEGTYITFVAKKHAIVCNISEASALGAFNGEFWGIFSLNQVVGNLITLALLQFGKEADTSSQSSYGTGKVLVTFLGSMTVGATLLCLLRPHIDGEPSPSLAADMGFPDVSQEKMAQSSFKLLSDNKMLLFVCLLVYTGMQQAFIWGDFTKDVITPKLGLPWVGGIMAAYGTADTFGSFVAGRSSSGLVSITIILLGGAFCQTLVLAGLFFAAMDTSQEWLNFVIIFAAAVVWGLGDAGFNTQISALLGILYPNDVEAGFAQWKIWQSAGTSAVFFASSYINFATKVSVLFFSLLGSLGLFSIAMMQSARVQ